MGWFMLIVEGTITETSPTANGRMVDPPDEFVNGGEGCGASVYVVNMHPQVKLNYQ